MFKHAASAKKGKKPAFEQRKDLLHCSEVLTLPIRGLFWNNVSVLYVTETMYQEFSRAVLFLLLF